MAKAVGPRPRALSAIFGAYFVLIVLLAYVFSPTLAGYVDPGATQWILTAYVVLGAVALLGIGGGGLRRSSRLEDRIEALEAKARRARDIERATHGPENAAVVDSGSADTEVEALLARLEEAAESAMVETAVLEAPKPPASGAVEELLKADAWEIDRLHRLRKAVAVSLAGPAIAAIALVGAFAPLVPSADGMLVANLQWNAFVGVAGLGVLLGIAAYGAAAFRQTRPGKA